MLYKRLDGTEFEPVCSDDQYNMYEDMFRIRFPNDERFWKVGQYDT